MQRIFTKNGRKAVLPLSRGAQFSSSGPKPNPFESVRTSLGANSFYKLPALGDSRLGKYPLKMTTN
jgi:hypothetical protein